VPQSPFAIVDAAPLAAEKFRDPKLTAKGEPRAYVTMTGLTTLWFCTGTLCNLACVNCYIESSPKNDALVYLTEAEVVTFLDEIAAEKLPTREMFDARLRCAGAFKCHAADAAL
jgi:hypothetical protein